MIEFARAPPAAIPYACGKEFVPMLGQAYAMPFYGVSVWIMLNLYAWFVSFRAEKKTALVFSGWARLGLQFVLRTRK